MISHSYISVSFSLHRDELPNHAPLLQTFNVPVEKRGLLIGRGGETIRRLEVPEFLLEMCCYHLLSRDLAVQEILGDRGRIEINQTGDV